MPRGLLKLLQLNPKSSFAARAPMHADRGNDLVWTPELV